MNVGRVCRKTRGKEAGEYCVVVGQVDKNYVLIDGKGVRRKKTNILHLEPLPTVIKIRKGASSASVEKAMEKGGFLS